MNDVLDITKEELLDRWRKKAYSLSRALVIAMDEGEDGALRLNQDLSAEDQAYVLSERKAAADLFDIVMKHMH